MTPEQIEMMSFLSIMRHDFKNKYTTIADIVPQMEQGLAARKAALVDIKEKVETLEDAMAKLPHGQVDPAKVWEMIRMSLDRSGYVMEICERFGWEPPPDRSGEGQGPDGRPLQ